MLSYHDDVINWKHFPRYWPFVRGIYRSLVNSPHKGQWRGTLMFSLFCIWKNGSVNTWDAGDLRCHRTHYDFTLVTLIYYEWQWACRRELVSLGHDKSKLVALNCNRYMHLLCVKTILILKRAPGGFAIYSYQGKLGPASISYKAYYGIKKGWTLLQTL